MVLRPAWYCVVQLALAESAVRSGAINPRSAKVSREKLRLTFKFSVDWKCSVTRWFHAKPSPKSVWLRREPVRNQSQAERFVFSAVLHARSTLESPRAKQRPGPHGLSVALTVAVSHASSPNAYTKPTGNRQNLTSKPSWREFRESCTRRGLRPKSLTFPVSRFPLIN